MIHPKLKSGMIFHANKFNEIDKDLAGEKHYALIYRTRRQYRGGFCKEAAMIVKALGIPTDDHWSREAIQQGWKSSYHIEVITNRFSLEHQVDPEMKQIIQSLVTNKNFEHILKPLINME